MLLFQPNSRIQKIPEGILFYEQDALCLIYNFSGDQKIEIALDYISPGIGIIIEDAEKKSLDAQNTSYLLKLGSNDFRVYRKHLGVQDELHADSCSFSPGTDKKNVVLVFNVVGKTVSVCRKTYEQNGISRETELASYRLEKFFNSFYISLYAGAGNIIRAINILSPVPKHWHVSTKNSAGGRIRFDRCAATMENCEQHGELEQKEIRLSPGTYWLKYDKKEVQGQYDIKAYVLDPEYIDFAGETNLEDEYKNILEDDGSFRVSQEMSVNLKFKGHNGQIKNIALVDNEHSSFIETTDAKKTQNGSEIVIRLNDLDCVEWEASIFDIPPWENLSDDCPYAVILSKDARLTIKDLCIRLGVRYKYRYDVQRHWLTITSSETDEVVYDASIQEPDQVHPEIIIMKNVTGTVYRLLLTGNNGGKINPLVKKTFKKYLSSAITSPVLVTEENGGEPFDLSASYREVVTPKKRLSLYSKERPLILEEDIPTSARAISIYGIPFGAALNAASSEIRSFASVYEVIAPEDYTRSKKTVIISDRIRSKYEYLVIEQSSIDSFTYEFTNYEREIFSGADDTLHLQHAPAERDEDIIIYAVPQSAEIHEKYLYRIPDIGAINSIDYYTDRYEIVTPDLYTVDRTSQEIVLSSRLTSGAYSRFIVDYLKKNSYAINYRNQHGQYEIDISTEGGSVCLHYDMHDDGTISDHIHTKITPDNDKYIVLKKKEGAV